MPVKKKVTHHHQHHHHHTPEEIMQALAYQEQGKTIKRVAAPCGVSASTVRDWNRQYRVLLVNAVALFQQCWYRPITTPGAGQRDYQTFIPSSGMTAAPLSYPQTTEYPTVLLSTRT
jgi:response regulator of citrate/malate metabolism